MLFVIFAALLPVALLAGYIYREDRLQPEPKSWLWKAAGYGVIAALLDVGILSQLPTPEQLFPQTVGTPMGAILTAFLSAGIPEEACKLFMLMILIRKNPYFDDKFDGIVYASYIGLGFAGFENIGYLVNNLDNFMSVAVSRAIFSVPGHFFFGVLMGYFVSRAYFGWNTKRQRRKLLVLAYVVPMLAHGVFDSILMVQEVAPWLSGTLTIFFIVFCIWLRRKGLNKIESLKSRSTI